MDWRHVSIAIVVNGLIIFHTLTMMTDEVFYHRAYYEYGDCEFSVTKNLFKEPMIDHNDCGIPRIPFEEWRDRQKETPELPYEINWSEE